MLSGRQPAPFDARGPTDNSTGWQANPGVPIVENLEDLWKVNKLQRERKAREKRNKAKRLAELKVSSSLPLAVLKVQIVASHVRYPSVVNPSFDWNPVLAAAARQHRQLVRERLAPLPFRA